MDIADQLSRKSRGTALTMAQQLEKRGEKRGEKRAEARKNRETILKGKELGLGIDVLAQLTGLPSKDVLEIWNEEEIKE